MKIEFKNEWTWKILRNVLQFHKLLHSFDEWLN